jgi:hypothetical protein
MRSMRQFVSLLKYIYALHSKVLIFFPSHILFEQGNYLLYLRSSICALLKDVSYVPPPAVYSFVPMIAQPRAYALYGNGAGLSFAPVHKNHRLYILCSRGHLFYKAQFSVVSLPTSDVKVLHRFLYMKSRKLICEK